MSAVMAAATPVLVAVVSLVGVVAGAWIQARTPRGPDGRGRLRRRGLEHRHVVLHALDPVAG